MDQRHLSRRHRQQRIAISLSLGTLFAIAMSPAARGEQPAAPTEKPEVLATFDGGEITRADFERVAGQKSAGERARIAKPGGREALLESLIRYDILALEAERRGYGDRIEVRTAVQKSAGDRLLATRVEVDPASIPAEEVRRAYDERHQSFGRPHMRRATQIRVATEAEANQLIKELATSEREPFARVAREKNIDPRTRNQGGELGYFDRNGLTETGRPTEVAPTLVREVFGMRRVGEVSRRPIAHDGSFSVLMLTGEMSQVKKSFAELEPVLREQLAAQHAQRASDALLAELRDQYELEVHPELIDAIQLPKMEPRDMPEGFAAAPPDPRAPPIRIEPDGI